LALVLIVVLAIGLQRLLSLVATSGEGWAEAMLGPGFHTPLNILAWIVSIRRGLGVVLAAVFLMPRSPRWWQRVVDEVADHVEREHYPAERPGTALPFGPGHDRGRPRRAAHHPGLSDRAAVRVRRRRRLHRILIATAWLLGREYSSSRQCGFARPRKPSDAQTKCRDRFYLGAGDRGIRIDPDRQPGDALFGMASWFTCTKRLSARAPN